MHGTALLLVCLCSFMVSPLFAGIDVTAPQNGATVQSPVHFSATAGSTSCPQGVASMGIYTSPGVLAYAQNGTSLDTDLSLDAGVYDTTIQQWDYCGGSSKTYVTITVSGGTGVFVTAPVNNSTSPSPVHFAATATTTCSKGVASMGIYPSPYHRAYVSSGATLNTNLSLSPGTYHAVVEEWDNCGGASTAAVTVTVSSGGGGGSKFSNLQASDGWLTYGELPPDYAICSSCGPGVTWQMSQQIKSPSLSGDSTKYSIGGTTPYSDVLWVNHLIGPGSTQGLPDNDQTIVPTLYNFTYDTYFYGTDLSLSENLEFDLGQFFDNTGLMFGLQCQIVNGSVWGLWDDVTNRWVATSIPCKPQSNSWNHVTFQFQRTSDNQVKYLSVTLNGVTTNINKQYGSFSAVGWYGLVLNFQLDGNYNQSPYSVYLDNLTVTY